MDKIDFKKIFNLSPEALKRIEDEEKKPKYDLVYFDSEGNKFKNQVTIRKSENGEKLIYLGCSDWNWDDIISHYPYKKGYGFCNDMCGRNHFGYKTSISAEEMNKIIEFFVDKWDVV